MGRTGGHSTVAVLHLQDKVPEAVNRNRLRQIDPSVLHKGGPNRGVFIQVVGDDSVDVDVPGKSFTFGTLKRAQALGDLESLRTSGRRVTRVALDELQGV